MRRADFFGQMGEELCLNIGPEYITKLLRHYMIVRMYCEKSYYVLSGPNMTDIASTGNT